MAVVEVVEGLIDLIRKNIIAKTNLTSNVLSGTDVVVVENSYHFQPDQEVILIDYGYNNDNYSPTSHYNVFEYARIKKIISTTEMLLYENITGDWYTSDLTFIQKTIGHAPLYENRLYYGDREVIPTEDMAVAVEPVSMSNEWIYIQGGLSEEYRMSIIIYGKDIETEEGMKVLNKYTDAIYQLVMDNLHTDINNVNVPILADVVNQNIVTIKDSPENREAFPLSTELIDATSYQIQDNLLVERDLAILDIDPVVPDGSGEMRVTLSRNIATVLPLQFNYSTDEFATLIRYKRYFYDTRADNVEYGVVQKGSAFIRAARINWFGKEVEEHKFPQGSKGVDYFPKV